MCVSKPKPTASQQSGPPTIIDTSAAARDEQSLRRKRSGTANLYKSGSRLGDLGQPSVSVTSLLGQSG